MRTIPTIIAFLALFSVAGQSWGAPEADAPPTFEEEGEHAARIVPPQPDALHKEAFAWLESKKLPAETLVRANEIWPAALSGDDEELRVLDRLAELFALGEPRAKTLVDLCSQPKNRGQALKQDWLNGPDVPPLMRRNLLLYYGRWLALEGYYEESLEAIEGLAVEETADPAALLFYRGVASHRLLKQKEGMQALTRLNDVQGCPRRYAVVAELMLADLTSLKEESLDHISRRMEDIRRRLDLGRAGRKVRKIEDGVIDSLDKIIEELEKKQQQQQQQSNLQSQKPARDSMPLGGKGPGETVKKKLGNTSGWGDLPPKKREEALQQIGKDFPPHYRDLIEQYFRKLAAEGEQSPPEQTKK